jgi:hypothetical protein
MSRQVVIRLIEKDEGISLELESIPPLGGDIQPGVIDIIAQNLTRSAEKILDSLSRQPDKLEASSKDGRLLKS